MKRWRIALIAAAAAALLSGCVTETVIEDPSPPPPKWPAPQQQKHGWFSWLHFGKHNSNAQPTTTTEIEQPFPADNTTGQAPDSH